MKDPRKLMSARAVSRAVAVCAIIELMILVSAPQPKTENREQNLLSRIKPYVTFFKYRTGYQANRTTSLVLLLALLGFTYRSARRLVFSAWAWDIPIWHWLWWPMLAGSIAVIFMAIGGRRAAKEHSVRRSPRRRWVIGFNVAALFLFVLLGWLVADSGPALLCHPAQAEVGQPGGWILVGGLALGRPSWQPAFLVHLQTGCSTRIGYFTTSSGLISPPSLMEYAISVDETAAAWVEPIESWLPWPGWFAFAGDDYGGWPMRLILADIREGRIRKTQPGIVFESGIPTLAVSPDGSRVAVQDGKSLVCLDCSSGEVVTEVSLADSFAMYRLRNMLHFASPDELLIYSMKHDSSPTGRSLYIHEVNLADQTILYTGNVEEPGYMQTPFFSPNATYLVVKQGHDNTTLHDGRTGVLLYSGEAMFQHLETQLGYAVRPYLEPRPSEVSIIPDWLAEQVYGY